MTRLRTIAGLLTAPWTPALSLVQARLLRHWYRATFLAAAARSGLLGVLAGRRRLDAPGVARALGAGARPELIRPWLDIGVEVGVLDRDSDGRYGLRGTDARLLARDRTGVATAGLLESVLFHQQAILGAPRFAVEGGGTRLDDLDPAVIARSSRLMQPLIEETVRDTVRDRRPRRWLEVGAGDGHYAAYAAGLDPVLDVTCLEAQERLVDAMTERFAATPERVRLRAVAGDVRTFSSDVAYDVVTLHNLIYYFDPGDRADVVDRCRKLLRPGGTLLLTTSVPGGPTPVSALDLWFRCGTSGAGLPGPDDVTELLEAGGFSGVRTRPLPPLSLVAATGQCPA